MGNIAFKIWRGRRVGLSLALCYVLLANALLSASLVAQFEIAQADPLRLAALSSICRPDAGETDQGRPSVPAHHQADCTFCCGACPMGSCASLAVGSCSGLGLHPIQARALSLVAAVSSLLGGYRLYPSDTHSQAPPALA